MTDVATIRRVLAGLKSELADKYHVSTLGLFGSVVRDDFDPINSDIDIIVDFSKPIGIEFVDLADYLERKLKKPIDLVSKSGVKEKYFKVIEPEIIYV
nr:nucleotidyltransferase domain-containing protein [uncultured Flavobacterium sp.]